MHQPSTQRPLQDLSAQLVASPACLPAAPLEELLSAYRLLGFTRWEGFSEWAAARFDWTADADSVRAELGRHGFSVASFHLPIIREEYPEKGLEDAVSAARFAAALGARIVLLKASTRELFGRVGRRFLDALEVEQLPLQAVVQNHKGTAITTIEDYLEVLNQVDHDPRLGALLEVGHFARIGVSWQQGWEAMADRIALIHINDIKGGESVPYGQGDVDFAGLLRQVRSTGYTGGIVVELELPSRRDETAETLHELRRSLDYLHGLNANS